MAKPTKKVSEVIIKDTAKPLPVTLDKESTDEIKKTKHRSKPPETTEEEDRSTLGQRNINLIWEHTQSQIAKATIYSNLVINLIVVVLLILYKNDINKEIIIIIMACLASMNGISGIIIGFYFSRTNHSAIGGTGKKTQSSNAGTR